MLISIIIFFCAYSMSFCTFCLNYFLFIFVVRNYDYFMLIFFHLVFLVKYIILLMYCFITYWSTDKSDILCLYKLIKMNTLQKKSINIGWKFKKFIFFNSPFYVKKAIVMHVSEMDFLKKCIKKFPIKSKWTINILYSLGFLFLLWTSDQH